MELGLSSAAAPDATVAELVEACARRGLRVLELREEDAHGVRVGAERLVLAEAAALAAAGGVRIGALRVGLERAGQGADAAAAARALGCVLLAECTAAFADRLDLGRRWQAAGAPAALVVRGGGAVQEADAALAAGLAVAWDAVPGEDLAGVAKPLLERCGERLVQVCVHGAGPEGVMHEGAGIGAVMRELALSGYGGGLVLAPSSPRYRTAWRTWLGRRRGWGCGGTGSDPLPILVEGRAGTKEGV
jgi:hypothetical protein